MKKWFALLVAMLLLMSCCAYAETAEQLTYTFELFCAKVGLPYEGEWVSFDDAFYVYWPETLAAEALTDEQRASGMIASYSMTDELNITLTVQISKQENVKTLEEINENLNTFCSEVIPIQLNGIPVIVGRKDCRMYADFLLESGAAYRISYLLLGNINAITEVNENQAMYVYGILYSISTAPIEMAAGSGEATPGQSTQEGSAMPEDVNSVISIQFDFRQRTAEDLEQLNRMLATMELTDLTLENFDGYLTTRQEIKNDVVVNTTYRYGLDSGTLVCKNAGMDEGYRYQIMTETFPKSEEMTVERYVDDWRANRPDQKLRTIHEIEFDGHIAFLVLYFEKSAD